MFKGHSPQLTDPAQTYLNKHCNHSSSLQGCSASSINQIETSFEKQPLDRPAESEDESPMHENKVGQTRNGLTNKDATLKSEDNYHVTHHTRIVLLSHEKENPRSTDSDSIVPIFHNNNNNNNNHPRLLSSESPCCESRAKSKRNTSSKNAPVLPNGLKGVLKTGRYYHKDPRMLVNPPMKTVTFMDSVTVLSVY